MKEEYDLSGMKSRPNPYTLRIESRNKDLSMTLAELLPGVQQLSEEEKIELVNFLVSGLSNQPKEFSLTRKNDASDLGETELPSNVQVDPEHREAIWQRIMSYSGSVKGDYSTDNENIDADLARAYANDFE